MPEPLPLPLSGRVILAPSSIKIDELTSRIFRPPEQRFQNSISWG
jgi:hypothetical protein